MTLGLQGRLGDAPLEDDELAEDPVDVAKFGDGGIFKRNWRRAASY